MSGLSVASTKLTLKSNGKPDETFHGAVAVSANPTSTTGTDDPITHIWASRDPDASKAHVQAATAATTFRPHAFQALGSSHVGALATLQVVHGETIQVTKTTMTTEKTESGQEIVKDITAWTD